MLKCGSGALRIQRVNSSNSCPNQDNKVWATRDSALQSAIGRLLENGGWAESESNELVWSHGTELVRCVCELMLLICSAVWKALVRGRWTVLLAIDKS